MYLSAYTAEFVYTVRGCVCVCVCVYEARHTLVFQTGGVGVGGWGASLHDRTSLLPGQQHLLRVHGAPNTEEPQWYKDEGKLHSSVWKRSWYSTTAYVKKKRLAAFWAPEEAARNLWPLMLDSTVTVFLHESKYPNIPIRVRLNHSKATEKK